MSQIKYKVELTINKSNAYNYFLERKGHMIWVNPLSKRGKELLELLGVDLSELNK